MAFIEDIHLIFPKEMKKLCNGSLGKLILGAPEMKTNNSPDCTYLIFP